MKATRTLIKGLQYFSILAGAILILVLTNYLYQGIRNSLLTEQEKKIEDLEYLTSVLINMHADFNLYADSSLFAEQLEHTRLLIQDGSASDTEIQISFMKLVALMNDPHTRVNNLSAMMPDIYPYYIIWFDDGPYLVLTPSEYESYLGAKVIGMDGVEMDQVYSTFKQIVPHSNDSGYKDNLSSYLRIPKLLHGLGLAQTDTIVTLQLEKSDGTNDSLSFYSMTREEYFSNNAYKSLRSGWSSGDYPLFQRNRTRNYWYEYFEDQNVLYVKYNRAYDDEALSGKSFWNNVLQVADSASVKKLVVDARGNGGGDNYFHLPLVKGIKSRPYLGEHGRLFTIFDRGTFSAAITFVADMEKETPTILVGGHMGDRPNTTGDARYFTLPHSGIQVGISTLLWEHTHAYDNRKSIEPDIYIGKYFEDYATGNDRVIDSIMAYTIKKKQIENVRQSSKERKSYSAMFSPFQELTFGSWTQKPATLTINGLAKIQLEKNGSNTFEGKKYRTKVTLTDSPLEELSISIFDTALTFKDQSFPQFDLFTQLRNETLLNDAEKLNQLMFARDSLHILDRTKLNKWAFQAYYYEENQQLAMDLIELNEFLNGDDPFVYIRKAELQSLAGDDLGTVGSYLQTGMKMIKRYFTVEHMNDHYLPF